MGAAYYTPSHEPCRYVRRRKGMIFETLLSEMGYCLGKIIWSKMGYRLGYRFGFKLFGLFAALNFERQV